MEQAADRPEAPAIDRLISTSTENISHLSLFTSTKEQTDLLSDAVAVY